MRIFFPIILFLSAINIDARSTMEELKKKISKLNLASIGIVDLCTDRKINVPKLQLVKVWSINCTNCLWEFEDLNSKLDHRYTLINVDTKPIDRKNACKWLNSQNIKAISLNDNGSIKKFLNESYPLPMSFTVKNNSVTDIEFGYWRKK